VEEASACLFTLFENKSGGIQLGNFAGAGRGFRLNIIRPVFVQSRTKGTS
jgi:hypothetical protein